MTRRLIFATCLLGVLGGAVGTAVAGVPVAKKPHQVCVVLTKDDNTTQDYCVDWGSVPQR